MPRKRSGKEQPRNRYRFTREDCQKGYRAALAKCSQDWHLHAWFYYRIRGWYRRHK
jgi:hypothetical protein